MVTATCVPAHLQCPTKVDGATPVACTGKPSYLQIGCIAHGSINSRAGYSRAAIGVPIRPPNPATSAPSSIDISRRNSSLRDRPPRAFRRPHAHRDCHVSPIRTVTAYPANRVEPALTRGTLVVRRLHGGAGIAVGAVSLQRWDILFRPSGLV